MTEALDALCRLLRGAPDGDLPGTITARAERLLDAARSEGVAPLLYRRLGTQLRNPLAGRLRQDALQHEALELLRQPVLVRLLGALAATGIEALLMKGAALAYTLYDSPGQRPRADTDILVRERDIPATCGVLSDLGYRFTTPGTGSTLSYQFVAMLPLGKGGEDALDVHWRLNNRLEFARLFDFDELHSRARPVPALGPGAFGPGLSDALLLACLHRIGHLNEGEPERLIWLHDIHLMLKMLDEVTAQELITLVHAKGLVAICAAGIGKAVSCFGTRLSPSLAGELRLNAAVEPSRRLLGAGPLRTLWVQWLAQPDWRHRWFFLRELAFPPAEYMHHKYPDSSAPVVWLYLRRGIEGIRKRW